MATFLSWVTSISSTTIATIGGVDISVGLILGFVLITNGAVFFLRRIRRL